MTTHPADIAALRAKLDELTTYLLTEPIQFGSIERRKALLAHRIITDLVRAGGGTPEQRAWVTRRLTEISEGRGHGFDELDKEGR